MVDEAKCVVAQVNDQMPWLGGDAVIPVKSIDYFVEWNEPLQEVHRTKTVTDIDRTIAANVASLINDGDTLQMGMGAVPETVMTLLKNHKHLGIHTEFASTGIIEMMDEGVVDNSMKTLDMGYSVCSMLGGTKEFYDNLSGREDILMKKSSYVIDPRIVAQQRNMVSIQSAVQLDMYGQVCADMIGYDQLSGVGGQLDFIRGSMMSEGGRSILCMTSTACKGKVSRIVPVLNEGAAVTDTRYDVMYIITEYGIADLFGKTIKQRAQELIKIAHPDFREGLERYAFEHLHLR